MGSRNVERITTVEWRATAETVGAMRAKGWSVWSVCAACALRMKVDLGLIERVSGPDVVLWGRRARCRRIGCAGAVEFRGRPPQLNTDLNL